MPQTLGGITHRGGPSGPAAHPTLIPHPLGEGSPLLAFGPYEARIHSNLLGFPSWLPGQGSARALHSRLCDAKENAFHAVGAVGILLRDVVLIGEGCFLENIAFEDCDSFSGYIKGH